MLANPEVEIPPGRVLRAEISSAFKSQSCFARRPKIRRAAEHPRHVFGKGVQRLARGVSGGDGFAV
jgi:hypothetical protein